MQHAAPHKTSTTARPPVLSAEAVLEARLQAAIGTVAQLVVGDPTFIPIFERLEQELANIRLQNDAVGRARALLRASHQNAMR